MITAIEIVQFGVSVVWFSAALGAWLGASDQFKLQKAWEEPSLSVLYLRVISMLVIAVCLLLLTICMVLMLG